MRQPSLESFNYFYIIYKACTRMYGCVCVCVEQLQLSRNNRQTLRNCVGKVLTLSDWQLQLTRPQYKVQCSRIEIGLGQFFGPLFGFELSALLCFTLLYSALIWFAVQFVVRCIHWNQLRICWALNDKHFSNLLYSLAYLIARADRADRPDRADKLCQCGQDANALALNNWTGIVSGLSVRK